MAGTVQEAVNAMSVEDRDIFDLIVGAASEDVVLEFDEEIEQGYALLSPENRNILDFVVGGVLAKQASVSHSGTVVENFLAHHGVKGMRWGVRKEEGGAGVKKAPRIPGGDSKEARKAARAATKAGNATLGQAHLGALKSKGHRVANAFLGDRTYWKTTLAIAGLGLAGVGVAMLAPGVMPTATLAAIGAKVAGTSGVAGHVYVSGQGLTTTAAIGASTVKAVGATGVGVAAYGANIVSSTANLVRAVRGNARINKSYETLGANLMAAQHNGSKQVQKVLGRNGSISKKALTHSGILTEYNYHLAHASTSNTSAAIMLLPPAIDPVRLVGEEEKHATLLFFGDTDSLPDDAKTTILETLGTASTMFRPFSEEVIDVTRLGADVPPALVSKLSDRCMSQIRNALQINPSIVTYMKNATQHPQFTPHVTLGYPDWDGEAKLKELCKTLYSINFDRIALWWNDERFEFKLGQEQNGQLMMKMPLGDFLAHHGVKGMKWGIRRDRSSSDGGGATRKNLTGDKQAVKAAKRAAPGTVAVKKDAAGNVIGSMVKMHDGTWKDTELSADAEKFVKARMKPTHEMSDAEIRTAISRAQLIKQYNDFFSDKPDAELQTKVAQLELEKRYRELSRQLTPPPKKTAVQKFISGAGSAYTAYSKLDKATGGAVATQLGKKLHGALDPEAAAAAARKASLENTRFEANVKKAVAEAARAEAKLREKD